MDFDAILAGRQNSQKLVFKIIVEIQQQIIFSVYFIVAFFNSHIP